jgi:hypothetical protein
VYVGFHGDILSVVPATMRETDNYRGIRLSKQGVLAWAPVFQQTAAIGHFQPGLLERNRLEAGMSGNDLKPDEIAPPGTGF